MYISHADHNCYSCAMPGADVYTSIETKVHHHEGPTNEFRVGGSSEKAPAASDWGLPIEGLEELHSQHSALAVVPFAVQRG